MILTLVCPVTVNVIKSECVKIEIHLPLFSLHFTKRKKKSQKGKKSLSARTYISIIAKTLKRFDGCTLVVKRVAPPQRSEDFSLSTLIKPYGYQSLIYAALAYIKTHMQELVLLPGAVAFIPDNRVFLFDAAIKGRLYKIAFGAFCLYKNIRKEKRLSFS